MIPGIFAKTFVRPDLASTLDAVAATGLRWVQFNFACCGLPTLPERIDPSLLREVRAALEGRGLRVAAVSATFNLIHPDPARRQSGLERLPGLAAAARELGAPLLTLCTGTRDPEDMWRWHADNDHPSAWRDLRAGLDAALECTGSTGIALGIEPELGNVVNSARACRRLLDEAGSDRLRVVMDGANLLRPEDLGGQERVLAEAFGLLGEAVALAHAKEIGADGHPEARGPGAGVLDWGAYLGWLRRCGYDGALVLHGLAETAVQPALAHLHRWI